MEIDKQQDFRDDRGCCSLGSNYRPCSQQSRKMSIGVLVDSVTKKSGVEKEAEKVVGNAEKITSTRENSLQEKREGKEARASVLEREGSPWISTRDKSPISKTGNYSKQASRKKLSRLGKLPPTYSVHFFSNQNPALNTDEGKKKSNSMDGKDGTAEKVENQFSFGYTKEASMPEKVVVADKTNRTENRPRETLKLKLLEILGTVSSPNRELVDSRKHKADNTNLKPKQNADQKSDNTSKPRQNSDSIETDSENPNDEVQRPVTRSLTRKRAPAKEIAKKTVKGPSSGYEKKDQEKSIFSFEEGWSGRLHSATSGGSLMSKLKRTGRPSDGIKQNTTSFTKKTDEGKDMQATDMPKPPAEKSSSFNSRMEHSGPSRISKGFTKLVNEVHKKDMHQSPGSKEDKPRDPDSPTSQEIKGKQENYGYQSFKNILNAQYDFQSPIFGLRTPIRNSSPSTTPNTVQVAGGPKHPVSAELFTAGSINRFRNWQTSKPDGHGSNASTESYDEEMELESPPARKSHSFREEKLGDLSNPVPEERNSDRSEDDSAVRDESEADEENETLSPGLVTSERAEFIFRPPKRLRTGGGIKFNDFTQASSFQRGTVSDEDDTFKEPSEQDQEDGFSRAVTLFALALQRLDSKIKSLTRKKSSEILTSIAERIRLQMQNVESQIQTDIGKLTSASKLKRKHLETGFQEKQEQLNLIHEKFKEEITQHLQDCKSTLEGLEANQIDFKGTIERQKASHRKLLLQMEEEIDTQLNDAQKKIVTVNKLARGKMLQLKSEFAECLKEGIFSGEPCQHSKVARDQ